MPTKAINAHGARACTVEVTPREVDAGGELTVRVLVSCPHGCDLRGQGVSIQRQNADAIAEASLQMAIATGRISAYDAAQVQAQLHTQAYQAQLTYLQDALKAIADNPALGKGKRRGFTTASGVRRGNADDAFDVVPN